MEKLGKGEPEIYRTWYV